jgi:hypothetical protein
MKNRTKIRFYSGIALLAFGTISPLFGFLIAKTSLPGATKATIIGFLTVGGPEIFTVLAAAALGKENFERIKSAALSAFKRLKPTARVGKARYTVGLIMFVIPVIPTYVMGYAPQWLPDASPARLYVNLAADLIFVSSLFVLGGDFWDKLTALFVYDARSRFDDEPRPGADSSQG